MTLLLLACASVGGVDTADPGGMCTWVCDVADGPKYTQADWSRAIPDQAACEAHADAECAAVWGATWVDDDHLSDERCCVDLCSGSASTPAEDPAECEANGECWALVYGSCDSY